MALRIGSQGPLVAAWQDTMRRRFSGYALESDGGPLRLDSYFGYSDQAVANEWQRRMRRPVLTDRRGDIVTDEELAILGLQAAAPPPPPSPVLPWILAIGGHLGTWDTGPAYWTALPLHQQGRAIVQGTGYDAARIPFNNASGFNEVDRLVRHVKPPGVPWAAVTHSQGSLIFCDYWEQRIKANSSDAAVANFMGGVNYGNPRAPMGVVAPWVHDPPDRDSEGLDPDCLDAQIPGMEEVRRKGDLYADKKRNDAGEMKQAVYLAVARGRFFGPDSLAEQLGELVTRFGPEVWAVFSAIKDGISFAVNMDPHNIFDLRPGTDHLARILNI